MTKTEIIASINYNVSNPDNIRLYHGTTSVGKDVILKTGFAEEMNTIWNCSEYDKAYFYEFDRFVKAEGIDDEDYDFKDIQYRILLRTNESGQIQEATLNKPGTSTYVFEILLPPEAKDFIEEDDSCDRASETGAVQMDVNIINSFIEQGKCTINIYSFDFFPKMAYFYIANLIDNEYTQDYFDDLSKAEYSAINAIRGAETYSIWDAIVCELDPVFIDYIGQFDALHLRNDD